MDGDALHHGYLQGGDARPPFWPEDIERVKRVMPAASERRRCRLLGVPRSSMHAHKQAETSQATPPRIDVDLAARIQALIAQFPSYGYRRIWALLTRELGIQVNRKKVYRIMKLKNWLLHERKGTPGPG